MKSMLLYMTAAFFMCAALPCPAQEKLEIINADRGRGEITDQGIVRHLEGNIHLRQGTAELFCEQVTWYVDLHKTVLQKNVRFVDG